MRRYLGVLSSPDSIIEVAVRLGAPGTFLTANPIGPVNATTHTSTWSTWTTDQRTVIRTVNDTLQITAGLSAGLGPQTIREVTAVIVDRTPPGLGLMKDDMTKALVNAKTTFPLPGRGIAAMPTLPPNDGGLNNQGQSKTLPTSHGFTRLT